MCELAVQPGDVLLAGSDGLWDNCYDEELLRLLPASPEAAEQVRPLWDNCCNEELLRLSPASPEAAEQARPLLWGVLGAFCGGLRACAIGARQALQVSPMQWSWAVGDGLADGQ